MPVVAAIADSSDSRIVEEAEKLATAFDRELHVVHVISMGTTDADIGGVSDDSSDRLREIAKERTKAATEGVSDDPIHVGLVDSNPSQRVISYASEVDAEYIVIGGRKRSPTGKAIFGSAAQSILLNANRPVLSIFSN
ncbi:universal stress protein [Natrarchaeobius chitinivorans]|uniref:Universal stress protein n=1 Tax=Natrarchaeobius chitinivorans TaxID=1679083 RepID=A0A3N6LXE8_NATCH|nr:universal stress protein [Natrarchaeobius chitinivorans]RQG95448.1 universal stress protein [Natrarchaeobius chitinivorans]